MRFSFQRGNANRPGRRLDKIHRYSKYRFESSTQSHEVEERDIVVRTYQQVDVRCRRRISASDGADDGYGTHAESASRLEDRLRLRSQQCPQPTSVRRDIVAHHTPPSVAARILGFIGVITTPPAWPLEPTLGLAIEDPQALVEAKPDDGTGAATNAAAGAPIAARGRPTPSSDQRQ